MRWDKTLLAQAVLALRSPPSGEHSDALLAALGDNDRSDLLRVALLGVSSSSPESLEFVERIEWETYVDEKSRVELDVSGPGLVESEIPIAEVMNALVEADFDPSFPRTVLGLDITVEDLKTALFFAMNLVLATQQTADDAEFTNQTTEADILRVFRPTLRSLNKYRRTGEP